MLSVSSVAKKCGGTVSSVSPSRHLAKFILNSPFSIYSLFLFFSFSLSLFVKKSISPSLSSRLANSPSRHLTKSILNFQFSIYSLFLFFSFSLSLFVKKSISLSLSSRLAISPSRYFAKSLKSVRGNHLMDRHIDRAIA